MEHFNLEEFAGGKLSAQINKALEKVTENIQDPNTEAKKARKISVSITLHPSENRNYVTTSVETKTTLAPEIGAMTALSMGKDIKTGKVEAVEILNQLPGQMSIQDIIDEEESEEEPPKAFDPETGEIYEPSTKVIDLRAAR